MIYACSVSGVDLSDDPVRVTGYSGTHLNNLTRFDVRSVFIPCSSFNLRVVPQGILEFFPNIILLRLSGCFGVTLTGSELIEYQNLEGFGVNNGDLERIPGNLFRSTPKLRYAIFESNLIERVGAGLFDNLMDLEIALFGSNVCVDKNVESADEIQGLTEVLRSNCTDF